jgi:hypothetical protein
MDKTPNRSFTGTRINSKQNRRKPSPLMRDAGEPVELFIILPPNFDRRRPRRVMLVLI